MNVESLFQDADICPEEEYILYVQTKVILLLKDRTVRTAKILDAVDRLLILETEGNDTECIPYDQVADLYYYGPITRYFRKRSFGYIDGIVRFEKKDRGVAEELLPLIYYDEYKVVVACHLMREAGHQEMRAKDIRILEKENRWDLKCLKGLRVRLEKTDQTLLHARVLEAEEDKLVILNASYKKEEIPRSLIASVNKTADRGDTIRIRKKDGTFVTGVISEVSEALGHIAFTDGTDHPFEDIADYEYVGSHISEENQDNSRKLDDKYAFWDSYVATPSFDYQPDQFRELITKKEGIPIYYKLGLSANGLIAKEIHLHDDVDPSERFGDIRTGIIVYYNKENRFGYVGNRYVEGGLENVGNAQFQMSYFKVPFMVNLENIYVVKYKISHIGEKYDFIDTVFGFEEVEHFAKGLYKEIRIEEDAVIKVPFEESERRKGEITAIQISQGMIRGEDGQNYVFSTENIMNKQNIRLSLERYQVSFVPFHNGGIQRAKAVRIEKVTPLITETQNKAASAQEEENRFVPEEKDILRIYRTLLYRFEVEKPYLFTEMGQVLKELGFAKDKTGKQSEFVQKELSDFVSLIHSGDKHLEFVVHRCPALEPVFLPDEETKKKIYEAFSAKLPYDLFIDMPKFSEVLNEIGIYKDEIGMAHAELLDLLKWDFIEMRYQGKNLQAKLKHCEKYDKGLVFEEDYETGSMDLAPIEEEGYEYGFVILRSSLYGLIRSQYIQNAQNQGISSDDISDLVMFDPGKIICDQKMNTGTNVYLVKFVRGVSEFNPRYDKEIPAVDYAHPILVVTSFKRKQYASITMEDGALHWKKISSKDKILQDYAPSRDLDLKIPEAYRKIVVGETFLTLNAEGNRKACICENAKEPKEILKEDPSIREIFRVGYVTEIDFEKQVGTINGMYPFQIARMDPKTLNVLKTLKGCDHGTVEVAFSYAEDEVDFVTKLSSEFLSTISWQADQVAGMNADKKELYFNNSKTALHHLSVSSDAWVYKLFSMKSIVNAKVYTRSINLIPVLGNGKLVFQKMVVAVHCKEERGTIHYDGVTDQFFAARNATYRCVIKGDRTALEALKEQETIVYFIPSESEKELIAALTPDYEENTEETAEESEAASADVVNHPLSRYYLKKSEEEKFMFREDMVDPEGRIKAEKAEDAVKWLAGSREMLRRFRAASIMLSENIPSVYINVAKGRRKRTATGFIVDAYDKRVMDIMGSPNGIYAEYSYLISIILNSGIRNPEKYRYYLLAQDFYRRDEFKNEVNLHSDAGEKTEKLFQRPIGEENIRDFIGHVLLLDDNSFDLVLAKIAGAAELSMKCNGYIAANFEEVPEGDILQRLKWLKNKVSSGRRRMEQTLATEQNIADRFATMLEIGDLYLRPVLLKEEEERFATVSNVLRAMELAKKETDFNRRIDHLQNGYRDISDLVTNICEHPTKYAFEVLVGEKNALGLLAHELLQEINSLYQQSRPNLSCKPNQDTLTRETGEAEFILANSFEDVSQSISIQNPSNVQIEFESASVGALVEKKPRIDLGPDGSFLVKAKLDLTDLPKGEDAVTINYTIRFHYYSGYNQPVNGENSGVVTFQLDSKAGAYVFKDYLDEYDNPYTEATTSTKLENMFFGRTDEIDAIWSYLVRGEKFSRGRAVIIYGQKKTGKTALVEKIAGKIEENTALRDQAIMLSIPDMGQIVGSDGLARFHRNFYKRILDLFVRAVEDEHPDVRELFTSGKLALPDTGNFDEVDFYSFFERFTSLDKEKHTIILMMDEFTRLTTQIRHDMQYHDIPSFMKTFANMGFIQMVIGHDSMMRAFEELGVINTCAEFSRKINVTAFKDKDARALITKPMEELTGMDVYSTPLGEMAIQELMDLSGNSPCYLMRLCDAVCAGYLSNRKPFISYYDVENMVSKYMEREVNDATYFDILLYEDGDDYGKSYIEMDTFKFLKCVAERSRQAADRACAISDARPEGMDEETINDTREILASRQVIEVRGGRIKIHVGLFARYIFSRFGTEH